MAKHLLTQMERDQAMQTLLCAGTNNLQFIQLLNAYGNIGECDRMRQFYTKHIDEWKQGKHDLDALMTALSIASCPDLLKNILDAIMANFDLSNDCRIDRLIVIHRSAKKLKDRRMKELEAEVWQ